MDYLRLFLADEYLRLNISAVILGMIRIISFVGIAPIFGPAVTTPVKSSICIALYMPIHPYMVSVVQTISMVTIGDFINIILLVAKEVLIGVILGWIVSLFFYIALSAGTIVDNQRGASMAQTSDFLSGAETSPLGAILFLSVITLFFASGSFLNFLELFYMSFTYWDIGSVSPDITSQKLSLFSIYNLAWMMKKTVQIAAPFIVVALLSDVSLGLINRFAPQLNVFILSMPIKSGICSLLIIFYYGPFLGHSADHLGYMNQVINNMLHFFNL